MKLDDVDSDNILFENVLVSPETDAKLRTQSRLSVMDQILIQCLCIDIRNNNPKHGLITEQIGSYIQRVLVGVAPRSHADAPSQLDRLQLLAAAQVLRGLREQSHQGARHSAAAGAGGPAEQRDHAAALQQGGQQEQRAGVGATDGGLCVRLTRSTSTARATRRSGR